MTRYRSRGGFTNPPVVYTDYNCTSTVTNSYGAGIVGEYVQTWDEKTPHFFRRIKNGEIIVNHYHNIVEMRRNTINGIRVQSQTPCPPGSVNSVFVQDRSGPQLTYMLENNASYGRIQPHWVLSQEEVSRTMDLAVTKMWSKVNNAEAQSLVTLAELPKTFRMLARPLGNFKTYLKSLRKAKNSTRAGRAMTFGQYISNEWLTYRYGFRPLLMDIEGTLKALNKKEKRGWTRAKASETLERTTSTPFLYSHGDLDTTFNLIRVHRFEAFAGVMFDANLTTSDYLGVNLSGIPLAAWELIPYSFVVDWFVNVGTFIEGLLAYVSTRQAGGYRIYKHTLYAAREVVGTVLARNVNASTLQRQMSGSETLYFISKERQIGVPAPSLRLKFDTASIPVDSRILDSVGLILQKLRK